MSEEFEFVCEFVFKNALLGLVKIFEEGLGKVYSVYSVLYVGHRFGAWSLEDNRE